MGRNTETHNEQKMHGETARGALFHHAQTYGGKTKKLIAVKLVYSEIPGLR